MTPPTFFVASGGVKVDMRQSATTSNCLNTVTHPELHFYGINLTKKPIIAYDISIKIVIQLQTMLCSYSILILLQWRAPHGVLPYR